MEVPYCGTVRGWFVAGTASSTHRPGTVLWRSRDFGRPTVSRWQVHRFHEAVEQDPQHLGQANGRAVRHRTADHRRYEAANTRVFLEPRQQVRSLRTGYG